MPLRLFAAIAFVSGFLIALPTRAGDVNEPASRVTLHVPDDWKKSDAREASDVMKLTLQKGVPTHPDDFYVLKIGHIAADTDMELDKFKGDMVKSFPAEWKALETSKATVGKQKIEALRVPYTFETSGIPFRMDLFLFRRGRQFTFLQFVGTQKAYDALNKELLKIVDDADVEK
jgi:hypothetical protein